MGEGETEMGIQVRLGAGLIFCHSAATVGNSEPLNADSPPL